MQVRGDAAFEHLVQELRDRFPGRALSLNDIAGEAALKGLELVVTVDVQVKTVERLSETSGNCPAKVSSGPTFDI